jgi:hypothetical protein
MAVLKHGAYNASLGQAQAAYSAARNKSNDRGSSTRVSGAHAARGKAASSAEKYKTGTVLGGRIISEKIEEEEDKNSSQGDANDMGEAAGEGGIRRRALAPGAKKNFL